jgi:hypothetical protein
MHEQRILKLLEELNETTAKFNKSGSAYAEAEERLSPVRVQIAGEFAKFLRQSIVLLPPEASADYCSKCGKKL